MVGIFVNYDRVRIPQPVGDVCQIERRDTPIEVIEPEARGAATLQVKDVAGPKSACEVAVFEWMIQMESGIIRAGVVPDPAAVGFDVRRVRMPRLVTEVPLRRSPMRSRGVMWRRSCVRRRRRMHGRRPVRWYVPPADATSSAATLAVLLGVSGNGGHQKHTGRDTQ